MLFLKTGMVDYGCYRVHPSTHLRFLLSDVMTDCYLDLLQSKFKEAELLIHDKHAAHEVKVPPPKSRLIIVTLYVIEYVAFKAQAKETVQSSD